MRFDAAAIAAATNGALHGLPEDDRPGAIVTDSRKVGPGDWFLALVGERFDAHNFLDQVRASGCAGVVAQRVPAGWDRGFVQVTDTLVALQDLGRAARARATGPVIGITGSAGKTTTRAMTACAIGALGEVHATVGNLNNHIGVPLSLLAATETCAAQVIEMGMNAPGEIALLQSIAAPGIRLITNVGAAHLEGLGTLEGVAKAKGELFDGARPGDTCIVNIDDPRVRALPLPEGVVRVTYGGSPSADYRLVDAHVDATTLSTTLTVRTPQDTVTAVIPSPGIHLASNATAALVVAGCLGLDLADAARRLSDYAPVGMRLRIEHGPLGTRILNDAYNANPLSTRASLDTLAAIRGARRIAIVGDMLELGIHEAQSHRELLAHAAGLGLDLLAVVGPRYTAAAAALGLDVLSAPDAAALAPALAPRLHPGDLVLLKGSRGIAVERVLPALNAILGPTGPET